MSYRIDGWMYVYMTNELGVKSTNLDELTKAKIVHLILNRKTEEALRNLSKFYNLTPPEIVVGTIKGKRRSVYAVYVQKENKIYVINSDIFCNPFVVLHEFYHHVRTKGGVHRGSEKHANMFARGFVDAYKKLAKHEQKDMTTYSFQNSVFFAE